MSYLVMIFSLNGGGHVGRGHYRNELNEFKGAEEARGDSRGDREAHHAKGSGRAIRRSPTVLSETERLLLGSFYSRRHRQYYRDARTTRYPLNSGDLPWKIANGIILNARLVEELTAINQYMVHAEMCDIWKYEKLHKAIEKRAIDEMKHAEKLIARILFLEGRLTMSKLNKLYIGAEVPKMHANDHTGEETAIQGYNESIGVAVAAGDNGTRDLLVSILKEEEGHIDFIEAHLDQIKQVGVQNYLIEQMD